jgi:chromosome partitioning protein
MTLIPSRPSIADIEATAATLGVIKAWKKPFAYILNQTPLRGQRIDAAASTLSDDAGYDLFDVVAQPFVVMRNDHQDALTAGLAVSEYAPSGKSAEEMRDLWRWVETRLNCAVPAEEEVVAIPEFPILLRERLQSIQPVSSLPTWADTNPSWDACL